MKNWFCLALAVFMGLSLCACGGSGESSAKENAKGLQVGYAREKIMPDMSQSISLHGYGNDSMRLAQGILDYLYITCIAFSANGQTVLLMTQDLGAVHYASAEKIRQSISAQAGVPMDNIFICATHTHAAPAQAPETLPGVKEYNELYVAASIKAGMDALADLTAATLYGGSIQVDGMNFVRHYLMNDNTYSGPNFGSEAAGYKDHATPNDPTMGLLKIERKGDKEDILLMNWAAHPCFTGGIDKYDISADYIGTARTFFESETNIKFAFFLSGAGNQTTDSLMPTDRHNMDCQTYGQKLAQHAIDAMPTLEKLEADNIQTTTYRLTYAKNKEDVDKLEQAQLVSQHFASTGNRDTGNAMAHQYGISSVYHANAIVNRASFAETASFSLFATRVGDFAFVNAPYEMFAASAMDIRANSPFANTFVISCSTSAHGYFPTIEAFEYGCYESYICEYARGVAEDSADMLVKLLNDLK